VVINEKDLDPLVEDGLTDSKLMPKVKRESMHAEILELAVDYQIVIIDAYEIDEMRNNATNLNRIEINAIIKILGSLKKWKKAFVDACDRNADRLQLILRNNVQENIIAEHFADVKYPIVSAASVLAKVIRDQEIEKAHEKFGVDFGSGYSHDPKTNQFLMDYYSKHGELPVVARKSWETSKRVIRIHEQSNLDEFFSNAE
ncbi:MAG: ribonuclease HII, partial [Asgard group archaeon]|nr:ribonuclease HII [Asgard group archaeon]